MSLSQNRKQRIKKQPQVTEVIQSNAELVMEFMGIEWLISIVERQL